MAVTTATLVVTRPDVRSGARSVGPPVQQLASFLPQAEFSRADSTGLFVGVPNFKHDASLTVPYAADDAVELAYKFSLDPRVGLIPPRRVVLALSGTPLKESAQDQLRELRAAGARIEEATSGDILNLLKEQVAQAGASGLFVFSLATHGFLDQEGDAYILGSTSTIGSTETSLRTATLFDIAGQTARSLIFVDACRDRIGQTSRGASPDPATAAPVIERMAGIHGQVIFYAAAPGEYAYDDDVRQNGVFTRAVLDGMSCGASAPRGTVVVWTLHTFVENEVRRWIQKNRNKTVSRATQISVEGQTRNMPLAECWRGAGRCSRVAWDESTITLYDDQTRPMGRQTFTEPIVHAEVADLDADAQCEVIIGLHNRISVLNRDRVTLWSKSGDDGTLRNFTTGDLFRKHTKQIVALWNDERSSTSTLTVVDSAGKELSHYEHAGLLQHVTVGRATNMHHPKIAVTTPDSLLLLDPKKLTKGPLWRLTLLDPTDAIQQLRIQESDNARREIEVRTKSGTTWFNFDGEIRRQDPDPKSGTAPRWRNVPRRTR
jgi:hypothetical protein